MIEEPSEPQTEPTPSSRPSGGGLHHLNTWHRDPTFVREVYAQAVGSLLAALVIYVIAAYAGIVKNEPVIILFSATTVISLVMLIFMLPSVIRVWGSMKGLFIVWNERTDAASVRAKELYNPFLFRIFSLIASVALLLAALLS